MSSWTYIQGTIEVRPMGRTQAEMTYILQTVLDHLPRVTGSEGDMNIYTIQENGHNSSKSRDEFGQSSNLLEDMYGCKSHKRGWLQTQQYYIIVVDARLRDRVFKDTLKEFQNWLCRLAKRVGVEDVLVKIGGYKESIILTNDNEVYSSMFEPPSWGFGNEDGEPNWCEYLMWQPMKDSEYPRVLGYKYINDLENDAMVEPWLK